MYINRVKRSEPGASNGVKNSGGSGTLAPPRPKSARRGWGGVTEARPFNVKVNERPLSPWQVPETCKIGPASAPVVDLDNGDAVIIGDAPPVARRRSTNSTVVATPHSVLPSPLQFLPILFRHARLLEHAMSVMETLNPTLAAHRRKILCNCGEGFVDPEGAAVDIAIEDKAAPPREIVVEDTIVLAGDEGAGMTVTAEPVERRWYPAPLNIHRRRPKWLHVHEPAHH
jgi:hypothetical protein